MIREQEWKSPSIDQARKAQELGIDTESNHMSGALAGFYIRHEIMMKKFNKRNRK